jgi:transposase
MRTALPPITDHADDLKGRLQREHDGHRKPRLQMLYLLASGQAHTRQDVAQLLGVHRNTIGRWLALYAPPTNPSRSRRRCSPALSRRSAARKGLPRMRRCANGCARPTGWRSRTKRSTPWCAPASRPSSKWPGRVTQKNPDAIATFQASCHDRLQQAIPPTNSPPVRVFSQDESRFGLLTVRRRRLTARGVQPVGSVQHVFEWLYVYGAVEPTTGERFFLELPHLNAESLQLFVEAFAQAFAESLNLLLLDNSGAHTARHLTLPGNVRLVFLPPYCPELNPMERVWRDLKDALAWLHFPTLEAQQDYIATLLQAYEAATLHSLAG